MPGPEHFRCLDPVVWPDVVGVTAFSRSFAASVYCFKFSSANPAIFHASGSLGCCSVASSLAFLCRCRKLFLLHMRTHAGCQRARRCSWCSWRSWCSRPCSPRAVTGCTVSSGSFGLVFLAVGDCTGSGLNKGSEAGF